MNKYEKLAWILPLIADTIPFVSSIIVEVLKVNNVPLVISVARAFTAPVMGVLVLIALPVLRHYKLIPKGSDSIPIAIILAVVGILLGIMFLD